MSKQHLVFFNQYYPPDVAPTGVMLQVVVRELVRQGHEVTVVSSAGGYGQGEQASAKIGDPLTGEQDSSPGERVVRVRSPSFGRNRFIGKIADYLGFYLGSFLTMARLQPRADRVVALTTPPFLSVVARLVTKVQRGTHAHWVMDLYPDVMVAHGLCKKNSLFARLLGRVSRWGYGGQRCAGVMTLGPDMAGRLQGHGVSDANWVPLWSTSLPETGDENRAQELRRERGWEGKVVFLYSGNMGLGHRFQEFLQTSCALPPDKTVMAFFGGGKRKAEVTACESGSEALEIGSYVPHEDLDSHLRSADVHLASLEPAWDGCMVPSKIQGIFAAGKPVIFIGSRTCATGQWILQSGGGWVVAPDDLESLQTAFEEASQAEERLLRGKRAADFAAEHFAADVNAKKVAKFLSRPV